jgi:hypothetical protein
MKILFWSLILTGVLPTPAPAAFNDFEEPPHEYWRTPPRDAATRLHERMEKGEVRLPGGDPLTFLKAYLRELDVPETSQTLVFSKTALQRQHVHAANPRAIYFNEDVTVGYIPGARLEVAAVDPVLGGIFYIFDLPKEDGEIPKFERPARCLGCHAGSFTSFLPGLMTNSVFTQEDGRVAGTAREHFSGHAAPLADRWGGWIVTGETAGLRHLGSLIATPGPGRPMTASFGVPDDRIDATRFLHGARGDIGAMLVLDHTIGAVNRLMEANYRVRTALHQQGVRGAIDDAEITGEALEVAREQAAVLTRYLLFAEEAVLPAAGMRVDPGFRADYQAAGASDEHGRSLRELSLEGRMFRYRCSPMIDSTAFRGLPRPFRRIVWQTIRDALVGTSSSTAGAHLPADERATIVSILRATAPEFRDAEKE